MIHYGATINVFIINNSNVLYWLHQLRISCMFIKICSTPIQASDLDILASSYVSAYLPIISMKFFFSLKRIHEYISRSLLHQAASSEREDNGAWVEAMCRGVAEYVGLRVVVTSDGHTMLISFEIFNQIDLSIELLSIPVDYVKFQKFKSSL